MCIRDSAKSGAKPKRTILFIGFAGEEFGLLGAQAWVKAHKDKLPKIANLFNRDGGPEPPVGISVPKAMYADFVKISEPIQKIRPDYPFEVKVREPRKRPTRMGGTDASVFAIEGVPTLGSVSYTHLAVIIINVEKKIGRATSVVRRKIESSVNTSSGCRSLFFKTVSIITIATSTKIPKSIAPKESRFAGIFVTCIKIKAINRDKGMVKATNKAPRQLPKNKISTKTTNTLSLIHIFKRERSGL